MKGRILIGAAAIATSVAASIAQDVPKLYILDVKGPNLVGYYNVTVPAHAFYLIANQLNAPTNMLSALIPSPPPGSQFYKYNEVTGYSAATYDDLAGAWDGDFSLNPAKAACSRMAAVRRSPLHSSGKCSKAP